MAFKGRETPPVDFADLIVSLNKAKLQQTNFDLYQVLYQLINKSQQSTGQFNSFLQQFVGRITINDDTDLSAILTIISNINNIIQFGTFITELDETVTLPSSRQAIAGTGITFDVTTPGQIVINATIPGVNVMYVPLTDGNIDETQDIYAIGEHIMVPVLI